MILDCSRAGRFRSSERTAGATAAEKERQLIRLIQRTGSQRFYFAVIGAGQAVLGNKNRIPEGEAEISGS